MQFERGSASEPGIASSRPEPKKVDLRPQKLKELGLLNPGEEVIVNFSAKRDCDVRNTDDRRLTPEERDRQIWRSGSWSSVRVLDLAFSAKGEPSPNEVTIVGVREGDS